MEKQSGRRGLKGISIKWRIFLYLCGFCALLLLLLWLFQVVFLDSFYKKIKVSEVRDSAAVLLRNLSSADLDNLMEELADNADISIEILSDTGAVLHEDSRDGGILHRMPDEQRQAIISKAAEQGGELLEYGDRPDQKTAAGTALPPNTVRSQDMFRTPYDTLLYCRLLPDAGGNTIAILIGSVISPVNATVRTLRIQLFYITGAMVIFSIILALFIARWVSRPIVALNQGAKILASGRYDVTFNGTGFREINELSDTLTAAARELSKVEGLRNELIANISHDLRTPLTLIGGYAEAMRDLPDENTPENAQIIVDETHRLSSLVDDVLDLSKLQAGVQSLHIRRFNITRLLIDVIHRIDRLVSKDGYHISFLYERETEVDADEGSISQAFYNLVINAINYTGADKQVTVRQRIDENWVRIEVSDTGEGIAQENLPYIWERYYKVEKNHKRSVTGSGLGLSIVRSIIDKHAGQYGVASQSGQGSTFWFSLEL